MSAMKKYASLLIVSSLLIHTACHSHTTDVRTITATTAAAPEQLVYPGTRTVAQVDEYHGVEIADPYRWLEDDRAAETAEWVEAQNKITFGYLKSLPDRDKIEKRLTKLWNYEKYGLPHRHGDRYFFSKNDGLQNQSVWYSMESLEDKPRVLIDPNKLSKDGTIAISGMSLTEDGSLLAYALSEGGSDWKQWRVRDVQSGDLDDLVEWSKFSGASWTHDNQGFFYSRYDAPAEGAELKQQNYYQKLCYHSLGTEQAKDPVVYQRSDQKEWGFSGDVTEDGQYLGIHIWKGTERKNMFFYRDLLQDGAPVVELIDHFENQYAFVGNDGPLFFFRTDEQAPPYRLVAVDIRNPARANWRELIPQSTDTLRGVSLVNDMFVASYLHDAHSLIKIFDLQGDHLRDVKLPGLGTARGFGGRRSDTETFYSFTGFTFPGAVYRYDMKTGKSELFRRPEVDFNPHAYVTKQVFYTTKDGRTQVPMFVTHKKGLKRNGDNPTMLYGYGGFNISLTPSFSVSNLVWMEMGGVYAMPNLRGGGEYGKEWHEAGMKLNKQNVFDDFIAAAEWLIESGYTSADKLAIAGASNGGLLVGACMTQRPDLYAAALPAVGVLDMLRFHKFTIGWAWVSDYGSPDDPAEFEALHAYSPLHNLKAGDSYPATLITTADHDDRVFPAHSFKFAAALQEAHGGDEPVLIRVETKAGHGAGKPTTKRIEEAADRLAFVRQNLGMNRS